MLGTPWERKGTTDPDKGPEKKTDPNGFSLGVEVTPLGVNVNDCCLLNYDEKAKWLKDNNISRTKPVDACSTITFKGILGVSFFRYRGALKAPLFDQNFWKWCL